MAYKGEIPGTVNVRIKGFGRRARKNRRFQLLARKGKGWEVIGEFSGENEALRYIEQYHEDKDIRWRMDVFMRDFFACVGCGERKKALLEPHHIKPKAQFPELRCELDNGETDCLWRHALLHQNNPVVQNMILLRLICVLTERLYKPLSKCQKALLQPSNSSKPIS